MFTDAMSHRICPRCQVRLHSPAYTSDGESCRWLLVWHLLSHCNADPTSLDNLERFAHVHGLLLLRIADEVPQLGARLHTHASRLMRIMQHARLGQPMSDQTAADVTHFLAFLMRPASLVPARPALMDELYSKVACLLRGE